MDGEEQTDRGRRTAILGLGTGMLAPAIALAASDGADGGAGGLFRTTPAADENDGRRDFDFLHGRWTVAHRNRRPLDAGAPWQAFAGVVDCKPAVGGIVNLDDNLLSVATGAYRAATLRIFDPIQMRWSIYWISEKAPSIDPFPLLGRFKDGVGLFYSNDTSSDPPVRTQFKWWRITPTSARWEQALSNDGGATWIDNWFMDFSRLS